METKPITRQDDDDLRLRFSKLRTYGDVAKLSPADQEKFWAFFTPDIQAKCQAKMQAAENYLWSELDKNFMGQQKTRFVAIENRVHDNLRRLVCRARSGNMAKRIARALNLMKPNERGQ